MKAFCSGNACDWLIFKKCHNAVNNEINTCATYHRFFRSLVSFDSALSLKEGVPLLAMHFQVLV